MVTQDWPPGSYRDLPRGKSRHSSVPVQGTDTFSRSGVGFAPPQVCQEWCFLQEVLEWTSWLAGISKVYILSSAVSEAAKPQEVVEFDFFLMYVCFYSSFSFILLRIYFKYWDLRWILIEELLISEVLPFFYCRFQKENEHPCPEVQDGNNMKDNPKFFSG